MPVQKIKQKGFSVSDFALLLVVSSDIVAVKGLNMTVSIFWIYHFWGAAKLSLKEYLMLEWKYWIAVQGHGHREAPIIKVWLFLSRILWHGKRTDPVMQMLNSPLSILGSNLSDSGTWHFYHYNSSMPKLLYYQYIPVKKCECVCVCVCVCSHLYLWNIA